MEPQLCEVVIPGTLSGDIRTDDGEPAASPEIIEGEVARGYTRPGMYLERLGYFVDGVAVGSERFIRELLQQMREEGRYLRRKNPIRYLGDLHASLREQRSHGVVF